MNQPPPPHRKLEDLTPDALVRLFEHVRVAGPIIAAIRADGYGGLELFGPDSGDTVPAVIAAAFDDETCRAHRIKKPHLNALKTVMERLVNAEKMGPAAPMQKLAAEPPREEVEGVLMAEGQQGAKDKLAAEPPREEHGDASPAAAVAAEPARAPPPKPAPKKSKQARKQQPTVATAANDDDDAVELPPPPPPPPAPAPRPLPKPAAKKITGDEKSARGIILNNENNERSQMLQKHEQTVKADQEQQQKQQEKIQKPRTDLVAKEKSERAAIAKEEQTDFSKVRQQRSKSKKEIEENAMIDEMARRGEEKLKQQPQQRQQQSSRPPRGLFDAVKAQDVARTQELLEQGADANQQGSHRGGGGETSVVSALHMAVFSFNTELVRLLLAHGANPNAPDSKHQRSPLHWACGVFCRGTATVKALLGRGANANALDSDGRTPLFHAVDKLESDCLVIELLVRDGGANVNKAPARRSSPLGLAATKLRMSMFRGAKYHNLDVLMILLSAERPDINGPGCDGLVQMLGAKGYTCALRQCIDAGASVCDLTSALAPAAEAGHVECVAELLRAGADATKPQIVNSLFTQAEAPLTPLHFAALNGDLEMVTLLIQEAGPSIVQIEAGGCQAVHLSIIDGSLDVVKEILQAAPDALHARTETGHGVVHNAAKYEHIDVLEFLLGHVGVDIEMQDQDGWRPLLLAAFNCRADSIRVLLRAGADKSARSTKESDGIPAGSTALDTARIVQCAEVVKMLE